MASGSNTALPVSADVPEVLKSECGGGASSRSPHRTGRLNTRNLRAGVAAAVIGVGGTGVAEAAIPAAAHAGVAALKIAGTGTVCSGHSAFECHSGMNHALSNTFVSAYPASAWRFCIIYENSVDDIFSNCAANPQQSWSYYVGGTRKKSVYAETQAETTIRWYRAQTNWP